MKTILELLEFADGETVNIQIAQGKYHLKTTLREAFKQFKNEKKWHKQK